MSLGWQRPDQDRRANSLSANRDRFVFESQDAFSRGAAEVFSLGLAPLEHDIHDVKLGIRSNIRSHLLRLRDRPNA